jgi:hypothetical protein
MPQKSSIFSESILNEYMRIHERLLELKFTYLIIVNNTSIQPSDKELLQNAVNRLSENIAEHFDSLLSRDINDANITIFENCEREYLKNVKDVISGIIKQAVQLSPQDIDYRKQSIPEQEIDTRIVESIISGRPAMVKKTIEGLGRFQDYLIEHVYTEDSNTKPKPKKNVVEKELLGMKINVYQDRLKRAESMNLDILFKMKTKFETLFNTEAKWRISGSSQLDDDISLVQDEVCIVYDDLYNMRILFKTDTTLLNLVIKLAHDVKSDGIRYEGRISGSATAAGNTAEVLLIDPDPNPSPMSLEQYRAKYRNFLDTAELRNLYMYCLESIKKKKKENEEKRIQARNEIRNQVSDALDDLL